MIYRKFGKRDVDISQLGFGAMRFPLKDRYDPTSIDEPKATEMLYKAIDNGVNYVDTAYPYHRETSEEFLGKALKGDYRKKVFLATKMPMWKIEAKRDLEKYFDEQRSKLQTDVIDMYLLHALRKKFWEKVKTYDVLSFLDKIRKQGKISYTGFSFHDELPLFKDIVDAYPWTFCLIHLNYVDIDFQAGQHGMEYASQNGLAVQVMEPLRGGKLAQGVPGEIKNIIRQAGRDQTPAQFAFRWLYNRPEISCVLSGMSTLEQVEENIEFASQDHRNTLTDKEFALYKKARNFYKERTVVNCTQCEYCVPCPNKIPIPFILELYNDAYMYNALKNSRRVYRVFIKQDHQADKCNECGECEEKCPQHIKISEVLKKAHKLLKE